MTLNAPNQSSLNHSPFPILEHPSMHLAAQRAAANVPLFLHHKLLQCPLLLLCNAKVVLASFRPTFSRCLFTPHQASSSLKGERGNWKLARATYAHSKYLIGGASGITLEGLGGGGGARSPLLSPFWRARARGASVRAPARARSSSAIDFLRFVCSLHPSLHPFSSPPPPSDSETSL